jgi:hypothetical protein
MKKIICGMLMSVALVGNASAFEFDTNNDVLKVVLLQTVLNEMLGKQNTLNLPNATIHTGVAGQTGKITQCWTKFVYHSNGTKTPKVVCH